MKNRWQVRSSIVREGSPWWKRYVVKVSFEPGMKQWMCDGGWEWGNVTSSAGTATVQWRGVIRYTYGANQMTLREVQSAAWRPWQVPIWHTASLHNRRNVDKAPCCHPVLGTLCWGQSCRLFRFRLVTTLNFNSSTQSSSSGVTTLLCLRPHIGRRH